MKKAKQIVTEKLFGVPEIKHEPGNYYLHWDQLMSAVERAITWEREECAKIADKFQNLAVGADIRARGDA